MSSATPLDQLKRAHRVIAEVVRAGGDQYFDLFERLDHELERRLSKQERLKRALRDE